MNSKLKRIALHTPGFWITVAAVLVAVTAGLISPHNPNAQHAAHALNPPSFRWLAGTDEFGRDLFSRILFGIRVSMIVGGTAVAIAASCGTLIAMVAALTGRWTELILMRINDALLGYPAVLLAIILVTLLKPSLWHLGLVEGLTLVPSFVRIVRSGLLQEREREYVMGATAMGASRSRIAIRHLLPNILPALLVQMTIGLAFAINLEAALSFLGLGIQPPQASLGSLLSESQQFIGQAWWYSVLPGATLAVLLIGVNSLADGVRDVLDPRNDRARSAHSGQ